MSLALAVESSFETPVPVQECTAFDGTLPDATEQAMNAVVVIEHNQGVGSGVFISPDGVFLTAAHVVEGTGTQQIQTYDGQVFHARLVRIDVEHDVAVLAVIDLQEPVTCLRPKEEDPTLGANVFALGSPGGTDLSFSVSRGIVSGLRDMEGQRFVQTDASINPGNSGGPMLDENGEIVGIVSWKIAAVEFEGLSFAVPIQDTLQFLNLEMGEATELPESDGVVTATGESGEEIYRTQFLRAGTMGDLSGFCEVSGEWGVCTGDGSPILQPSEFAEQVGDTETAAGARMNLIGSAAVLGGGVCLTGCLGTATGVYALTLIGNTDPAWGGVGALGALTTVSGVGTVWATRRRFRKTMDYDRYYTLDHARVLVVRHNQELAEELGISQERARELEAEAQGK
jgi:hypothetical protein